MGNKFAIVTDSTADFPIDYIQKYDIHMVPSHVIVDGKDHLDGVSITNPEIIKAMKNGSEVSSTPPTPAEYADQYESLLKSYRYIVSLHISSGLSDCYMCAKGSMNLLGDHDRKRIKLVDTKTLGIVQALYVIRTIELLNKKNTYAGVEKTVRNLMDQGTNAFTVDSLKWLINSGRISTLGALFGDLMDIKPYISVADSVLALKGKHRGKKKILNKMAKNAIKAFKENKGEYDLWIAHCDASEDAIYLSEKLAEGFRIDTKSIRIIETKPSISIKIGPGGITCGMFKKI